MNKAETLRRICEFAKAYSAERIKTPLQLFAETGYQANRTAITDEEIEKEIEKNPQLLSEWLAFTEDKRWTPSWGISKNKKEYVVFHVSTNGKVDQNFRFESGASACALMVRKEMEGFVERST